MGKSDRESRELTYCAYLVRLWRDGPQGPWRAMAKDVATGQQHTFANPESLFVFLHEATASENDRFDTS